jgi:hypothetical protein
VPAVAGAVYIPDELTDPPAAPSCTDQTTAVLVVPATWAANCTWAPGATDALVGVTVTEIACCTSEVSVPTSAESESDGPAEQAICPTARESKAIEEMRPQFARAVMGNAIEQRTCPMGFRALGGAGCS